jgi:hypothetical protein
MCRCAERRNAIARGVRTLLQGEIRSAGAEANFVATSMIEDAQSIARQARVAASAKITAARGRLARR